MYIMGHGSQDHVMITLVMHISLNNETKYQE